MRAIDFMNKARKARENTGVSINLITQTFFFDALLLRLASSSYQRQFIFKGGFFLTSVFGLARRSTNDIDFLCTGIPLEINYLRKVVSEICKTSLEDGISFEMTGTQPIREDDEYGGFRFFILARLENIQQPITLDIATGDPITPKPMLMTLTNSLTDKPMELLTYNLETLLAEKFQTIISKSSLNSRSKDFYDVFLLFVMQQKRIDLSLLKQAITQTFSYRKTSLDATYIKNQIAQIEGSETMKIWWKSFQKRKPYAQEIPFESTLFAVKEIASLLH